MGFEERVMGREMRDGDVRAVWIEEKGKRRSEEKEECEEGWDGLGGGGGRTRCCA